MVAAHSYRSRVDVVGLCSERLRLSLIRMAFVSVQVTDVTIEVVKAVGGR